MKTLLKNLMIGVVVMVITACTRIESGQVGVQRDFSGEYSKESVPVGIHMTPFIHILFVKLLLV